MSIVSIDIEGKRNSVLGFARRQEATAISAEQGPDNVMLRKQEAVATKVIDRLFGDRKGEFYKERRTCRKIMRNMSVTSRSSPQFIVLLLWLTHRITFTFVYMLPINKSPQQLQITAASSSWFARTINYEFCSKLNLKENNMLCRRNMNGDSA